MASGMNPELAQAIIASAGRLGIDPVDLGTAMSYESGGTFSPSKWGGKNNDYLGLIQAGREERAKYGFSPTQTAPEQVLSSENFLRDRGVRPGMGMLDVYSTINAGAPGLYNRSDANNGGAPGTVADKVLDQMGGHRANALKLLGMTSGGTLPAPGVPGAARAPMSPGSPATASAPSPAAPTPPTDDGDAAFLAQLQGIPKMIAANQAQDNAPVAPVVDMGAQRSQMVAAAIAAAAAQQKDQIL